MRYRGRKGITLLEVLVSIFIMGIGMLGLLTLFLWMKRWGIQAGTPVPSTQLAPAGALLTN